MNTEALSEIYRTPIKFEDPPESLFNVFSERYNSTGIHEFKLYISIFKHIPNSLNEANIHCVRANDWFLSVYESEVIDFFFQKRCLDVVKEAELDDIYYILKDGLMVNFDRNLSKVRLLFQGNESDRIREIVAGIKVFKKSDSEEGEIELLVNTRYGVRSKPFKIERPRLSISDNYNDDFIAVHTNILSRLTKENNKGIVLLHGKPGTGKTSYIKFLLTEIKKKVIFLPPNLAQSITKPDLITLLTENPNSILVIEDAEKIVVDRALEGDSPVSALLNVSDGLLSDCLNIQIICSFNTDLSKIDKALLRKGRLIARYEFKELQVSKAKQLIERLGYQFEITSPQTLTEVYNHKEVNYGVSNNKNIGFKY